MSEPVRLAVTGAGRAFERLYQPALARTPGVRLVGLAEPRAVRAELAGPDVGRFPGLRELLTGCEVDAVIVLTPAAGHTEDALLALERGLPALVEKPVCLTRVEIAKLEAAGAERLLRPALSRRWWPAYRRIRASAEGMSDLVFGLRSDPRDWDPITREIDIVSDLLPHGFDTARWLTGAEVVSLTARQEATNAVARLAMSGGQRVEVRAAIRGRYIECARVDGRTFHTGPPRVVESGWRRLQRRPDAGIEAIATMLTEWAAIVRGGPPGTFPSFADGRAVAEATIRFREGVDRR